MNKTTCLICCFLLSSVGLQAGDSHYRTVADDVPLKVDVTLNDATEAYLSTAEFYLQVTCESWNNEKTVLAPLNIDRRRGEKSFKGIDLPPVRPEDKLTFTLLDEDSLTEEQRKLLNTVLSTTKTLVWMSGKAMGDSPDAKMVAWALQVGPTFTEELLRDAFEVYGTATCYAPHAIPAREGFANTIHILGPASNGYDNYAWAELKIYTNQPATPELAKPTDLSNPHELFNTFVTDREYVRPCIKIPPSDLDVSGDVYLSVRVDKTFPNGTCIILPVNLSQHCLIAKDFVQLPFETVQEDTIYFRLLQEGDLTADNRKAIRDAFDVHPYLICRQPDILTVPANILQEPALLDSLAGFPKLPNATYGGMSFKTLKELQYHPGPTLPRCECFADQVAFVGNSKYRMMNMLLCGK